MLGGVVFQKLIKQYITLNIGVNMLFWINTALAQETAAAAANQPAIWETFFPFIIIFVVFYFLVLRPQAKRARQQSQMISQLKKGDRILTSSGILGTIEGVTEKFVDVSISDGVRVKMLKSQISSLAKEVE